MNLTEVLKLAEDLVFARTGKHLNDLQERILRGTWEDEGYKEIAKAVNRSEDRVTILRTVFKQREYHRIGLTEG